MFQSVEQFSPSLFLELLTFSILQIWGLFHRSVLYQLLPPALSFLCLPHCNEHLDDVEFLWGHFSVYRSNGLLSTSSVLGAVPAWELPSLPPAPSPASSWALHCQVPGGLREWPVTDPWASKGKERLLEGN